MTEGRQEPGDEAADRATLEQLEARLARDVRDMLAVLRADVPVFVERAARRAFEQAPTADALDDAAVAGLKQGTRALGAQLAQELEHELGPLEPWLWRGAGAPPANASDLTPNAAVQARIDRIGAAVREHLAAHGLPAADDLAYRLPTYFVAGHFMKGLVEGYWQTLALHHELSARLERDRTQSAREARRRRWDGA